MGSNQTSDNTELIYQNYQIIESQNDTKILRDKQTKQQFILKQESFVEKAEYDRQFKRINQRQKQSRNYENILKLVKLWSKEQNGICSNQMKIYAVYQFPMHSLRQEIKTRKNANQPFEQGEIISLLQTCLNVVIVEPSFLNISPQYIFVDQNGVLKLIHPDLLQKNSQSIYCEDLYYSPERMEKFQKEIISKQQRQKQAVFSIGMTTLQAILLEKLNICYQVNMKRINRKKLDHYKAKLSHSVSQKLCSTLLKMLQYNQKDRITFRQISQLLESMNSDQSIHSFNDVPQTQTIIKPITEKKNTDCYLNLPLFTEKKLQGESAGHLMNNLKENTRTSYVNPIRRSQFEILFENQSNLGLQRQMKSLESHPSSILNPIFTDNKIMQMIKDGLQKIKKSRRQAMSQIKLNNQSQTSQTSQSVKSSCRDILSQIVASSQHKQQNYVVLQYQDQSKYEGSLISNMKNGFGKLIYSDGVYYEGNFKDDNLSGKGALFYGPNRPAYIGQWLQNKFHGFGTLYNEYSTVLESYFDYSDFNKIGDHWIRFQGYFYNDLKQGLGRITLTNGQIIEACFDKGVINGEGTFRDMGGKIIKGYWRQNKLVHLLTI